MTYTSINKLPLKGCITERLIMTTYSETFFIESGRSYFYAHVVSMGGVVMGSKQIVINIIMN